MNSRTRPTKSSRRVRLLAAMAAAAAVVAVIATSVALSGGTDTPRKADSRMILASVPRYYMALVGMKYKDPNQPSEYANNPQEAVIQDTETGAVLATIRPPDGYSSFEEVTGSADDRTFVLAAQVGKYTHNQYGLAPVKFFRVRFNPSSGSATLTALRIPELPKFKTVDAGLVGMALSPNGTEIAISVQPSAQKGLSGAMPPLELRVYSLHTGAVVRSWRQSGGITGFGPLIGNEVDQDSGAVSWAGEGTLAFNWLTFEHVVRGKLQPFSDYAGVWLLNTNAASGGLMAHSRRVIRFPANPDPNKVSFRWDGVLTSDGTKIVAPVGVQGSPLGPTSTSAFEEFSAATGRPIRILHEVSTRAPGVNAVEWTNSTGSVLVVDAPARRGGHYVVGVLSGNRFTPLPGAPPVTPITTVDLAF